MCVPVAGMDGGALSDANLTNSYFSSSFIGVNGFGSPAESKYSMMQVGILPDHLLCHDVLTQMLFTYL